MERGSIEIGQEVQDTITGYRGIVIAITAWFNGCQRINVQSREMKDGKPVESQVFDVEQLAYVGSGIPRSKKQTGGPCDDRTASHR